MDFHSFKISNRLFFLLVLFLFIFLFNPYYSLLIKEVHYDDASYLSHAFTLALDHNLQYQHSIAEWTGPSGIVPSHPIGPGLLAAPFVFIFSSIDWILSHPILDNHKLFQYSWSYFGFVFASLFYFLAGIALYIKAFEKLLQANYRKWIIFLSFSFGVPFYVLYRPTMGHSYEFFAFALTTWATLMWMFAKEDSRWKYALSCGAGIWLTLLIRPADIQVFLLPVLLWGLLQLKSLASLAPPITAKTKNLFFIQIGLAIIVCFLPLAWLYKNLYGVYYPSSAQMYRVGVYFIPPIHNLNDFFVAVTTLFSRIPNIATILFSSEFGLLYSAPISIFGIGLLYIFLASYLKNKIKSSLFLLLLITIYCAFPIVIVLFWQSPADSYGYRFLFCYFPIALFGFLNWLNKYETEPSSSFSNRLFLHIFLVFFSFSLLSNIMYGINDRLQYQEGTNSFGIKKESAVGYHTAVLKAILHPNDWVNLIAKRSPGFFAFGIFNGLGGDIDQLPIPNNIKEKVKETILNQKPPMASYVQGILLMILFLAATFAFVFFKENNNPYIPSLPRHKM